jgi:hypothetical protein
MPEDIDANFLNDQYWLLLPFHVIWDTRATMTDEACRSCRRGMNPGRSWW